MAKITVDIDELIALLMKQIKVETDSLSADTPLQFVNDDIEDIKSLLVTLAEAFLERKLGAADPLRHLLYIIALMFGIQSQKINHSARQNLTKYAKGLYLDAQGAQSNTTRLPASAASTIVQFTLSKAQKNSIIIPAGTRVTSQGSLFFATQEVAQILPGKTSIQLPAYCTKPGVIGNDIPAGTLTTLVDPIPFVDRVTNISSTAGGADIEDDESYRERVQEAPERLTTAGPTESYELWAKSASSSIADVKALSPSPGKVDVYPLLKGGIIPGEAMLKQVDAVLNARNRRPLTDHVTIKPPVTVNYAIDLTYYIDKAKAVYVDKITSQVTAADNAYIAWQCAQLGRDINPSELTRLIMEAGAKRVIINQPTYKVITDNSVAINNSLNVTFGGLEDA